MSAFALWLNSAFAVFDLRITQAVHDAFYPMADFFTPFFEFISLLGSGGIFLILLSLGLFVFPKTRRLGIAMMAGLLINVLVTNCFLKIVVARARPYTDPAGDYYALWQLVGQHTEKDKCFPSGHTSVAYAVMTAFFVQSRKKQLTWTVLIFSLLMGIARIYLVVHYPTDVIGGTIVGIIAGFGGAMIARRLEGMPWFTTDLREVPRLVRERRSAR